MRYSAWSSLAISACSALVLAGAARAHVDATPAFLQVNGTETISLTAHNDRRVTMEAFALTVPAGLLIDDVGDLDGWTGSIDGRTATWTGGSVDADDAETFNVVLEALSAPGAVSLRAEQRYADDRAINWPVMLTVVPADDESSEPWLYVVVAIGLVLAATGVALAWRRRDAAVRR